MVKSKVSEQEAVEIGAFVMAQDMQGLVRYLNRMLYDRGKGTDCCARPIAFRAEKDMGESCFAKGYLSKVIEFIEESRKRMKDSDTLKETITYTTALCGEIDRFFDKKKGELHG